MTELGCWLEGGKDPRNWNYPFMATPTRRSVLHYAGAPISDQGNLGSCVGHTCLDEMNYSMFWRNRRAVQRNNHFLPSVLGRDLYHLATTMDIWPEQWPPTDSGTSVLAGAKALKHQGYISSYRWAFTFSDFIAALERQPVMVGTLWTSGMFDPNSKGLVRPTGSLDGGHAYSVRGISFSKGLVRCRNHWTDDWGVNGEFFVTLPDMEWLLSQQGEGLVPEVRV